MDEYFPLNEHPLDQCVAAIYEQGKSIEECLAMFPEQAEGLEPLLRLTTRLQAARQTRAPADFRLASRVRLEHLLANDPQFARSNHRGTTGFQPQPRSLFPAAPQSSQARQSIPAVKRQGSRRPAWLSAPISRVAFVLAVILILLVSNTTISTARQSLPGEPMYPLKVITEKVQLAFSMSEAQDARLHLAFAKQRFDEMTRLLGEEQTARVKETAQKYAGDFSSASAILTSGEMSPEEQEALAEEMTLILADHEEEILRLHDEWLASHPPASEELIADTLAEVFAILQTVHDEHQKLLELLPDLPDLPGLWTITPHSTKTPEPSAVVSSSPTGTRTPLPPGFTPEGWSTDWPDVWPTLPPGVTIEPTYIDDWTRMTIPAPTQWGTIVATYYFPTLDENWPPGTPLPWQPGTPIPEFPELPTSWPSPPSDWNDPPDEPEPPEWPEPPDWPDDLPEEPPGFFFP